MIHALCMVIVVLLVMLVLSRASEPSMVLVAQNETQAARATVTAQATEIVYLRSQVPTPRRRCVPTADYYSYSC